MRSAAIAVTLCTAIAAVSCSSARADSTRALYVDDDFFSGLAHDADYTGGVAVTFAGKQSATHGFELEIGAAAFTPADVTDHDVVLHDRPYAGLVYASGTLLQSDDAGRSATTMLTVGVLGLPFISEVQRRIHRVMGSDQPRGWRHQISNGGEPTLRLAHEKTWTAEPVDLAGGRAQWLYRAGAGVGFLTDVSAGVAARFGRFSDQRWDIHTSPTGFSDRAAFDQVRAGDRFLYATLSARVPIYDALLQGQFRDSDVQVSSSDRRYLIPEMSLGFVVGLPDDRDLQYFIRAQRSDVRLTERSETIVYAGLSLSW